jgi:hypothetical protein
MRVFPSFDRTSGHRLCYSDALVKVRIKRTPRERELDGVRLDRFTPGTVRDVPAALAAWLVAECYAEPEMRQVPRSDDEDFGQIKDARDPAPTRHRRRADDA